MCWALCFPTGRSWCCGATLGHTSRNVDYHLLRAFFNLQNHLALNNGAAARDGCGQRFRDTWIRIGGIPVVVSTLILISVVLNCGGSPVSGGYSQYIGAKYGYDPGAFANGFKSICAVLVTAAFALAGTGLVGLAASKTPNDAQRNQEHLRAYFHHLYHKPVVHRPQPAIK